MGSTNISVSPSQEGSERDHGSGKFIPDTASRLESWLFEGQDEPQISLIHILPAKETNEFLQFIFPLRARAAKVLSVIQILYYIISTATTGAFHPDQLTAVYIGWRVAYFVGLALLLACALFGDAKLVSKVVHGWYIVATCLNIGILVSGVVLTTLSVGLHIALVATILLAIVTIGSTMHINFLMVFLLSVPEMTALLLSLNRAFSVDNDTQFTKVSLMAFIIIAYIVCIWTVHAVQYNTVMMFMWNKRYLREKIEKYSQKRMEELHRLHLANTLHDIGSPLQAFTNGIDELQAWLKDQVPSTLISDTVREAISAMDASTAIMTLARRRAIMYARSFTKINLQPQYSDVHLRSLVQKCLHVMRAFGRSRHSTVPLECVIDDDVPDLVNSDGDWILEILTNLVRFVSGFLSYAGLSICGSNSIKFTADGFVRVHLSVQPAPMRHSNNSSRNETTHMLHFKVIDTGRGISRDDSRRLFLPFSQLQENEPGSGLGLASAKKKIDLLGGDLGVEQNPPRGSVFWFEIPLHVPLLPRKASTDSARFSARMEWSTTTGMVEFTKNSVAKILADYNIDPTHVRLLIVEDEKMLLKFSTKMFAALGFNVHEACNGLVALELMQAISFDLVLMDQNMPELGGLEAVRMFREWQRMSIGRLSDSTEIKASDDFAHVRKANDNRGSPRVSSNSRSSNLSTINRRVVETLEQFDPLMFMMSASILESDRVQAKDLRITDYFEKPLHVHQVAAMILFRLVSHKFRLQKIQQRTLVEPESH